MNHSIAGVATLSGPPLAGSLYDMTKSYTILFLMELFVE